MIEEVKAVKPYPDKFLKMLTIEGFSRVFYEMTRQHKTYEQAYEACEDIFKRLFNQRRYSNYSSFRRSLRRHLS